MLVYQINGVYPALTSKNNELENFFLPFTAKSETSSFCNCKIADPPPEMNLHKMLKIMKYESYFGID